MNIVPSYGQHRSPNIRPKSTRSYCIVIHCGSKYIVLCALIATVVRLLSSRTRPTPNVIVQFLVPHSSGPSSSLFSTHITYQTSPLLFETSALLCCCSRRGCHALYIRSITDAYSVTTASMRNSRRLARLCRIHCQVLTVLFRPSYRTSDHEEHEHG